MGKFKKRVTSYEVECDGYAMRLESDMIEGKETFVIEFKDNAAYSVPTINSAYDVIMEVLKNIEEIKRIILPLFGQRYSITRETTLNDILNRISEEIKVNAELKK